MSRTAELTFFCYARADSDRAVPLARRLVGDGFRVWIDRLEIPTGTPWDDEIERVLRQSSTVLVLLTPAAVASQHVKDEFHFAMDRGARVVPVLLADCDVPFRLRRLQHIDLRQGNEDQYSELAASLRGTDSGSGEAQPPREPSAVAPVGRVASRRLLVGTAALASIALGALGALAIRGAQRSTFEQEPVVSSSAPGIQVVHDVPPVFFTPAQERGASEAVTAVAAQRAASGAKQPTHAASHASSRPQPVQEVIPRPTTTSLTVAAPAPAPAPAPARVTVASTAVSMPSAAATGEMSLAQVRGLSDYRARDQAALQLACRALRIKDVDLVEAAADLLSSQKSSAKFDLKNAVRGAVSSSRPPVDTTGICG